LPHTRGCGRRRPRRHPPRKKGRGSEMLCGKYLGREGRGGGCRRRNTECSEGSHLIPRAIMRFGEYIAKGCFSLSADQQLICKTCIDQCVDLCIICPHSFSYPSLHFFSYSSLHSCPLISSFLSSHLFIPVLSSLHSFPTHLFIPYVLSSVPLTGHGRPPSASSFYLTCLWYRLMSVGLGSQGRGRGRLHCIIEIGSSRHCVFFLSFVKHDSQPPTTYCTWHKIPGFGNGGNLNSMDGRHGPGWNGPVWHSL